MKGSIERFSEDAQRVKNKDLKMGPLMHSKGLVLRDGGNKTLAVHSTGPSKMRW